MAARLKAVRVERNTMRLPQGFDANQLTGEPVASKLRNLIANRFGDGWEIDEVDHSQHALLLRREIEIDDLPSITVPLPTTVRPGDADKTQTRLEDEYQGYTLTAFDAYRRTATLTRLTADEVNARGMVANAMRVKPWEIGVSTRGDGGFDFNLPTYVPSEHDKRLDEVATRTVGRPGWYKRVDMHNLVLSIIPGELPTFPPAYPYPASGGKHHIFEVPIGVALGGDGEPNWDLSIDMDGNSGAIIQGLAGAGKAEVLTNRVPVPVSAARPDGWASIGDLTNDDEVLGPDGLAVPVAGFSDVSVQDTFDVTFDDGQVVRVAADHAWEVTSHRSRSTYRARLGTFSRAGGLTARIAHLDALAAGTAPGTFATVTDLVRLCDVPRGRVTAAIRDNEMAKVTIEVAVDRGRGSMRRVRRYEGRQAAAHLREIGLGQDLTGRPSLGWATAKELAFALGLGTEPRAVEKVRNRLRTPRVDSIERVEFVEDAVSQRERAVGAYPVTEVARRLADFYRDVAGAAPLVEVRTTAQMADQVRPGTGGANWAVRVAAPLVGQEQDLPADPYELGRWLGGGKGTCAPDPAVHDLLARGEQIPASYRRALLTDRLSLLAGLMDAAGRVDSQGRCRLVVSQGLEAPVLEVVRSLGIKASARPDGAGTVCVSFVTTQPVFRDQDRLAALPTELPDSAAWLYVTSVVPAGRHKVRCLRIGTSRSMYLTSGFVPTHNSVLVNAVVFGALERGHELVIVDVPHKAADFDWVQPFVREHGFGCASGGAAVAAMKLVFEEGERRGKELRRMGVQKWQEAPASWRKDNPPITVVMDEVTGLFAADPIPKSLPKDDPIRIAAEQAVIERDLLRAFTSKIPAQMRFVGIRLILATQQAQSNTGIPPSVKLNLPNRILLGPSATKQARGHAFANPDACPEVPEYITADGAASRGVGVAELEGRANVVFKSYYADVSAYRAKIEKMGRRRASTPEPTPAQIAAAVPQLDPDGDDRPASRLDGGGWGEPDGRDAPEPRLRGAAAAAHQLRVEAAQAQANGVSW